MIMGCPYHLLKNHLNGVTLIRRRRKLGVFENVEKTTLVDYIKQMQRIGHPITLTQLWLKVAKMTQERLTPFKNKIVGWGWL